MRKDKNWKGRKKKDNSRKSVRWSAVPVPCLRRLWLKLRGEQGSGPKGVDDLCFHTYEEFSPSPSSDWDLGLWAEIESLGLGFVPKGWDLGLAAGIRVSGFVIAP